MRDLLQRRIRRKGILGKAVFLGIHLSFESNGHVPTSGESKGFYSRTSTAHVQAFLAPLRSKTCVILNSVNQNLAIKNLSALIQRNYVIQFVYV